MSGFDAVTLEVLWRRLISATDEAAAALVRTSFSTLVRESHDFSCIVTDERGQSLVQATRSIPSFIGTLPATVKHFLKEYPPETLRPGDVLITNDVFLGTGHLHDLTLAKPIFRRDRVVGFAATTAHLPDIGGKMRSPDVREVFEEGFQVPIMKLMSEGRPEEILVKLLRKNVRVPDQVMGDLWAQVVALDTMEARTVALMADHGLATLRELADEVQGRCERAMRAAIRELPDGTYRSALDTDGLIEEPLHVEMTLTVAGDSIDIDYAGSSPQVDRGINVAMCYTFALTAYGVKCCTVPHLPNNEGSFRPITVHGAEGCIVNPVFPASGAARMLVGHYLPVLVFGCLGEVVPERVMAASGSPMWGMNHSGIGRHGQPFANLFFFNGGMGASFRRDGPNVLSWPSNVSSTPVEICEQVSPFRIRCKRLRPDSGGAGRFRGGLGQEIVFENRSERPVAAAFLAERTLFPAFGIAGGRPGACGMVEIDGRRADPKRQHILRPGGVVRLGTPGGGGHGDPRGRHPDALAEDLGQGYVTDPSPYRGG
ncbi:MAG: hydantoinase B/oxoprolinase family protein [Proteobacteria bacterium]|nr:hydantoinase B/oxoprolinase family protein [Pseudomonadota bacterium]